MAGKGLEFFPTLRAWLLGVCRTLSKAIATEPKGCTAVRRAQMWRWPISAGVIARDLRSFLIEETVFHHDGECRRDLLRTGALEVHEALASDWGNRLRAGQVVTVELGLYYREIGGVRIEMWWW